MLNESQRDRLSVVLVSPRNPLNIGAAARAMANFGFLRLTVVAPYAPHWREARSAIGAPDLLQNAWSTECLGEAVAGCTLVVGTGTRTYRKPEQRVVSLTDLTPLVTREFGGGGRVALVFGPEKHGLTREDLSYCHLMVEIPTDSHQPSMNLGQAVAVCLYELASRASGSEVGGGGIVQAGIRADESILAATCGRLDLLAGVIEETMIEVGYSAHSMRDANQHDVRLLLRRLAPTERDTRRILGLFRRILWRLKKNRIDG